MVNRLTFSCIRALIICCLVPAWLPAQMTPELVRRFELCKALAEQGHVNPQARLGSFYFSGTGVQRDVSQAIRWWRTAAARGSAGAQFGLGLCYANGEGVPKDDAQAVFWYRKAAEQDDAAAQCELGLHYGYGKGVPEDDKLSAYWFIRSAEQGYARAQLFLSVHYKLGLGVAKSESEAYAWVCLAAGSNDEAKEELASLDGKLPFETRVRGRERSRELRASIEARNASKAK